MKFLRLASLGIAIWGLGLVWTEVNFVLTPPVTIGLVLGLGAAATIYALSQHHTHPNIDHAGRTHPTRPVPVVQTR